MVRAIVTLFAINLLSACGTTAPDWPERTVRVALEAPNPCWSIALERIYRSDAGLVAVSRLTPPGPGRMCTQVISTVSHQVTVPLPDGPVTHLVLGRTWNWGESPPGYEFPASRAALEERLAGAGLVREIGEHEGRRDAGGSVR